MSKIRSYVRIPDQSELTVEVTGNPADFVLVSTLRGSDGTVKRLSPGDPPFILTSPRVYDLAHQVRFLTNVPETNPVVIDTVIKKPNGDRYPATAEPWKLHGDANEQDWRIDHLQTLKSEGGEA